MLLVIGEGLDSVGLCSVSAVGVCPGYEYHLILFGVSFIGTANCVFESLFVWDGVLVVLVGDRRWTGLLGGYNGVESFVEAVGAGYEGIPDEGNGEDKCK